MHKVSVSQSIVDRVVARRGREHIFDDLVPAKTALVVVDMQNGFMLPEVGHAPCQMAHEIVPNINRLAEAVRSTGGTVIWIQTAYTDETLTSWSTLLRHGRPEGQREAAALALGRQQGLRAVGRPRDRARGPDRREVALQRVHPGLVEPAEVLRAQGYDTLLITGTVTNVCCESTARDAMMLNFKTIMVTDGNAASTDEDHNASLSTSIRPSATSCRPISPSAA